MPGPEAAKSNALMRVCKDLMVAHNLWNKDFVRFFQDNYCDKQWVNNPKTGKQEVKWTLKNSSSTLPVSPPKQSSTLTEKANRNPLEGGDRKEPQPNTQIEGTMKSLVRPGVRGKSGNMVIDVPNYGMLTITFFSPPSNIGSFEGMEQGIGKEVVFSYTKKDRWLNLSSLAMKGKGEQELEEARKLVEEEVNKYCGDNNLDPTNIYQKWGITSAEDLGTTDDCKSFIYELEREMGGNGS